MVRRSHKRRKRFACGHLGFGRFCHWCFQSADRTQNPVIADLVIYQAKKVTRKAAKQWQQSFAKDAISSSYPQGVELRHLPKPIVIKTRQILTALSQGVAPGELKGKRFNFDRSLLRIPVSYRYRLLCRWQADQIVPLQVMTHEAYNAIARNKKTPRLKKG